MSNDRAYFGRAVATVASNWVVGASGVTLGDACTNPTTRATAGSAYIFDGATGETLRILTPPESSPASCQNCQFDYQCIGFGFSLAALGDNVLVGDPLRTSGRGKVYQFDADPSSSSFGLNNRIFSNPTAANGDNFGYSVAEVGGNVLVGAPFDENETGVTDAGAAYLFDGTTGALLETFVSGTPTASANFGTSVGGVGLLAVIGEPQSTQGKAYVFDADPQSGTFGQLLHTLAPVPPYPTSFYNQDFGTSVGSYLGDIMIGAPAALTFWNGWGGAVYVFDPTDASLLRTITNPDEVNTHQMGRALAVAGTDIVATAPANSGETVYVHDGEGDGFAAIPGPNGGRFGDSVAALGSDLIVGAPYEVYQTGLANGVVYVYAADTDCGDGMIDTDAGELCDDGNTQNGDCCSSTCQPASQGVPCTDGNACTLPDTCDGAGHCLNDQDRVCDDLKPCTSDSCLPATGCKFTNLQNGTLCSDNNSCTGTTASPDVCTNGICVPGVCDQGKLCTTFCGGGTCQLDGGTCSCVP
jgi:cysteine-rich repeat protein